MNTQELKNALADSFNELATEYGVNVEKVKKYFDLIIQVSLDYQLCDNFDEDILEVVEAVVSIRSSINETKSTEIAFNLRETVLKALCEKYDLSFDEYLEKEKSDEVKMHLKFKDRYHYDKELNDYVLNDSIF
ncbi:MAG: hypothetical protein J5892_03530 [Bacilli bacterium]|nr:hypothetical protein [Bacilli bacterium]